VISDWRGERRIGRPSLGETLSGEIRTPLIITGVMTVGACALLLLRLAFGERYSPMGMITVWCLSFAVLTGSVIISSLLARRWTRSWLLLLLSAIVGGAVWFLAIPLLTAIGVLRVEVMIYPVTP